MILKKHSEICFYFFSLTLNFQSFSLIGFKQLNKNCEPFEAEEKYKPSAAEKDMEFIDKTVDTAAWPTKLHKTNNNFSEPKG